MSSFFWDNLYNLRNESFIPSHDLQKMTLAPKVVLQNIFRGTLFIYSILIIICILGKVKPKQRE